LRSFSALLREGSLLDDLMRRALPDMFVKELLRCPVHFFCRCDKQRFTSALALLPLSDLLELRGQEQELRCHYCNQIYVISEQEIEEIWCEKGADDWKHSKPN
jgi:molecular chaperone Hsp33